MLSFGQSSHGFKKVRAFESIAVLRARTARGQRPAFSQAPQVQIKQRVHQIQCQLDWGTEVPLGYLFGFAISGSSMVQ